MIAHMEAAVLGPICRHLHLVPSLCSDMAMPVPRHHSGNLYIISSSIAVDGCDITNEKGIFELSQVTGRASAGSSRAEDHSNSTNRASLRFLLEVVHFHKIQIYQRAAIDITHI